MSIGGLPAPARASRKRRRSSPVSTFAAHWPEEREKIWMASQRFSRPRSNARQSPPADDWWAPRISAKPNAKREGSRCLVFRLLLAGPEAYGGDTVARLALGRQVRVRPCRRVEAEIPAVVEEPALGLA